MSRSIIAAPVATFTAIGKNEMTHAIGIAGPAPLPNQATHAGTKATFGPKLNRLAA